MRTFEDYLRLMEEGHFDPEAMQTYMEMLQLSMDGVRGEAAEALLQRMGPQTVAARMGAREIPDALVIPEHLRHTDRPGLRTLEEFAHAGALKTPLDPESLETTHPGEQIFSLTREATQRPLYAVIREVWADIEVLRREKRLPPRSQRGLPTPDAPIPLDASFAERHSSPGSRQTTHLLRVALMATCSALSAARTARLADGEERSDGAVAAYDTASEILALRGQEVDDVMYAGFNSAILLALESAYALCSKILRDKPGTSRDEMLAALAQHQSFLLRHAGFHFAAFSTLLKYPFGPVDVATNAYLRSRGVGDFDDEEDCGYATSTHAAMRDEATVLRMNEGQPPLLDYNTDFFTPLMLAEMSMPLVRLGCPAREIHRAFGEWCMEAFSDVVLPQMLQERGQATA